MPRRLPGMRDCRGQASIEYLAVVGLLALVMGALAVPALAGQDIAGALVAQMRRALCVVSGGDCDEDRRPCVVDGEEVRRHRDVTIASFHYGKGRLTLRERRSDGTIAVTSIKDRDLGLETGSGFEAHVGSVAFGSMVRGALLARLGGGSTTVFADARAAARGAALSRERLTRGGVVAELTWTGATYGAGHAATSLVLGRSVDEATGRTTYALQGSAAIAGSLGVGPVSGDATAGVEAAATLSRTRDGRFVDLGIVATGRLGGRYGTAVPAVAAPVAGMLPSAGRDGARTWSLEQHLDLTDPENHRTAGAFLQAIARPGDLPAAGSRLLAALAERGTTDVRAYSLDEDDHGAGAHGALDGIAFGGGSETHTERTHLLAALQRGPDGIWRRRTDCLAAV